MIKKKICVLGAFATGKTSLVRQFVFSMFSEKYQTTVGVKVDKKIVDLKDDQVSLLIWDIHGGDDLQEINLTYLRGMSGFLLIVDGTRPETLDVAKELLDRIDRDFDHVPFLLLLNKSDLVNEWELGDPALKEWTSRYRPALKTSAKTADNVEDAFITLTELMMNR